MHFSLTFLQGLILFCAAVLGGTLNSVAGGGSFIGFPSLVFTGLPAIQANATNTIALWPGSVASVGAYRRELGQQKRTLLILLVCASLMGGTLGALLLLKTPPLIFVRLVPYLLLVATLLFALSGPITARLRMRSLEKTRQFGVPMLVSLSCAQLVIAVYGGYFGGGIGILMLATLAMMGMDNIHVMNALKTLLTSCINGVAVITFIVAGVVAWPQAILMIIGAVIGGYGGAYYARKIKQKWVRLFVILIGFSMTIYFFFQERGKGVDIYTLRTIGVGVVACLAILFILLCLYVSFLRKVGPNRALIVYGRGGTRVVTGNAKLVIPMFQRAQEFSLELMSFHVAPTQVLYTTQGVAVSVEAVTQIKVRSDEQSIKIAAEQFLSKKQDDRESLIRPVMEGHLRGIVGQLTVEDLIKDPEGVSEKMLQTATPDMQKMGLEVISFIIKDVRDPNGYITNMGRSQIAENQKQADIATALAERDTQIEQANAEYEAAIARAKAVQARVKVETESQTLQAESRYNLSLKQVAFDTEVKSKQAAADKAYDIQSNVALQQVIAEAVRVTEIEKNAQIKVQQAEIQCSELELQATVQNAAEAERHRIETLAEAERQRLILEAQGQADAAKSRGLAEADIIRARGLAEAEVIRMKGEAEAETMQVKAAAYHEYNQAAILDKLLTSRPEVVSAIAEPLRKAGKVTIVPDDNGASQDSVEASRLTADIAGMVAKVPALLEILSRVQMEELLKHLPALSGQDVEGSANYDKTRDACEESNIEQIIDCRDLPVNS